jgi:SAM-dependent methyltransferase
MQTMSGAAERLPFADDAFDLVVTRFSVHHWLDVPGALRELNRVLANNGRAVFIDIVSPETPLFDTTLQAVELLRDASLVRDYRVSEWGAMLSAADFTYSCTSKWRLGMPFNDWVARMRTPPGRVAAIHNLFDTHRKKRAIILKCATTIRSRLMLRYSKQEKSNLHKTEGSHSPSYCLGNVDDNERRRQ